MARFTEEEAGPDGWTDWVRPVMEGYKMACCDCGLVHDMDFRVTPGADGEGMDSDEYRVEFRVRRNRRSTGQMRRHMRGRRP